MQRTVRAAVQVLITLSFAIQLSAQVSLSLNGSKTYPATRIGLNQGSQDFYGTYLLKNLVAINPGFEGRIKDVAQNVTVDDPEKSYIFSFTGNNPPSGVVDMSLYSSPKLADNNESSMMVKLKSSTAQSPRNFKIPPHSAMSIGHTTVRKVSMPQPRVRAVRASFALPAGMFPTE